MTVESESAPAPSQDPTALALELLGPGGRADPYPLYAAARRLGPVLDVGGGYFLVTGYDAVNQALRHPGFGVTGAQAPPERKAANPAIDLLARSVLESDPPEHTRMRALMNSVFTPRRVAAFEPMVRGAVDELLDRLAGRGPRPVDFMAEFAFPLPVTVICEILGVPKDDRHLFRTLASDLTKALEFLAEDDSAAFAPANAAAAELAGYFAELVADRRAHPRAGDDLVGALLAARDADDGRLAERELLANLTLLLVAGFETTTDLLGNGLRLLFDHPAAARALRAAGEDRETVSRFVEEVLRYESPVQLTSRVALAPDLVLGGVPLPAGSRVVLLVGAANRDPARYADPERFDPTRTASRPLSFGAGAHICLGNGLARLEAAVAFPRLLARFPELAPDATGPTRRERVVLRGYLTQPVVLGTPADRDIS